MFFGIVDFLGVKPHAIEIHPGRFQQKRNNIKVLSKAIKRLYIRADTIGKF